MCPALFLYTNIVLIHVVLSGLIFPSDTEGNNETKVIDIRLPYVKVPAVETYYACQQFEIYDDKPYHVTRFEPIINNTEIIHHMLVFGCTFKLDQEGPHPCDSLDYRCGTWLVKWDIGMTDIIMPPEGGVRIGKGSFKYILLQIHWNNKGAQDDKTDSSGMRLHVTTNLRQYDIGNVQIGQNDISIPGDRKSVLISGTCAARCTGLMLPMPIYITNVYLHMHGLGTKAALDIQRDREVIERLAFEENYNFTQPIWHNFDPPKIVYPGHQHVSCILYGDGREESAISAYMNGEPIEMMCWYDSSTASRFRNDTTRFGQGSNVNELAYVTLGETATLQWVLTEEDPVCPFGSTFGTDGYQGITIGYCKPTG